MFSKPFVLLLEVFVLPTVFSKVGFLLSLNPGNGFNAEDDMPQSSLVPLSASSAHDSDEDIPLAELAQRLTPAGKTHYYRPRDS